MKYDGIVVGGGPAGMFSAITAAQKGQKVLLLERNDRLGKKILSTGNGKCNLGNLDLHADAYYGNDTAFIKQTLERFSEQDTVAFFKNNGIPFRLPDHSPFNSDEISSSFLTMFIPYSIESSATNLISGVFLRPKRLPTSRLTRPVAPVRAFVATFATSIPSTALT